jgi:hypothetical protein
MAEVACQTIGMRSALRARVVRIAPGDELFDFDNSSRPGNDPQALVFASLAEELSQRLSKLQNPAATRLAERGKQLAKRFRAEALERESHAGPTSLVGELIAFNRQALDLLSSPSP